MDADILARHPALSEGSIQQIGASSSICATSLSKCISKPNAAQYLVACTENGDIHVFDARATSRALVIISAFRTTEGEGVPSFSQRPSVVPADIPLDNTITIADTAAERAWEDSLYFQKGSFVLPQYTYAPPPNAPAAMAAVDSADNVVSHAPSPVAPKTGSVGVSQPKSTASSRPTSASSKVSSSQTHKSVGFQGGDNAPVVNARPQPAVWSVEEDERGLLICAMGTAIAERTSYRSADSNPKKLAIKATPDGKTSETFSCTPTSVCRYFHVPTECLVYGSVYSAYDDSKNDPFPRYEAKLAGSGVPTPRSASLTLKATKDYVPPVRWIAAFAPLRGTVFNSVEQSMDSRFVGYTGASASVQVVLSHPNLFVASPSAPPIDEKAEMIALLTQRDMTSELDESKHSGDRHKSWDAQHGLRPASMLSTFVLCWPGGAASASRHNAVEASTPSMSRPGSASALPRASATQSAAALTSTSGEAGLTGFDALGLTGPHVQDISTTHVVRMMFMCQRLMTPGLSAPEDFSEMEDRTVAKRAADESSVADSRFSRGRSITRGKSTPRSTGSTKVGMKKSPSRERTLSPTKRGVRNDARPAPVCKTGGDGIPVTVGCILKWTAKETSADTLDEIACVLARFSFPTDFMLAPQFTVETRQVPTQPEVFLTKTFSPITAIASWPSSDSYDYFCIPSDGDVVSHGYPAIITGHLNGTVAVWQVTADNSCSYSACMLRDIVGKHEVRAAPSTVTSVTFSNDGLWAFSGDACGSCFSYNLRHLNFSKGGANGTSWLSNPTEPLALSSGPFGLIGGLISDFKPISDSEFVREYIWAALHECDASVVSLVPIAGTPFVAVIFSSTDGGPVKLAIIDFEKAAILCCKAIASSRLLQLSTGALLYITRGGSKLRMTTYSVSDLLDTCPVTRQAKSVLGDSSSTRLLSMYNAITPSQLANMSRFTTAQIDGWISALIPAGLALPVAPPSGVEDDIPWRSGTGNVFARPAVKRQALNGIEGLRGQPSADAVHCKVTVPSSSDDLMAMFSAFVTVSAEARTKRLEILLDSLTSNTN
jgi:hypothetical protein